MPQITPNPHHENLIFTEATIRSSPDTMIQTPNNATSVISVKRRAPKLNNTSSPTMMVSSALSISQMLLFSDLRPFHQLPKLEKPESKTMASTTQPRFEKVITGCAKQYIPLIIKSMPVIIPSGFKFIHPSKNIHFDDESDLIVTKGCS